MKLTFTRPLDCGCTLQREVIDIQPGDEKMAERRAAYWFDTRAPRHVCALVSADNPNGLRDRTDQEQARHDRLLRMGAAA